MSHTIFLGNFLSNQAFISIVMIDVSIIVPTFDERVSAPILAFLIDKHMRHMDCMYELLIVDDASPDGTAEAMRDLKSSWPELPLHVLSRPGKQGLGSAYSHGLKHAQGEWVILMDADLSHHPRHIAEFIAKQQETGCDIVSGTRYSRGGGVAGWSLPRKVISRGANLMASFLLGMKVSDLTGSYRLYRKSLLQDLLSQTTSKGYAFQMEVIARAQHSNATIEEVPVCFVDRLFGESKLGPSEFLLFLKGLIILFFTL